MAVTQPTIEGADCTDNMQLCQELTLNITRKTPIVTVAREIARCLNEQKYKLILETIKVLGVPVTLDLYKQTSRIQKNGGSLTSDGERRRTPGGVFFMLVKKTTSKEQKDIIFHFEKKIMQNRKNRRRRLKSAKKKGIEEMSLVIAEGEESKDNPTPSLVDSINDHPTIEPKPNVIDCINTTQVEDMDLECVPVDRDITVTANIEKKTIPDIEEAILAAEQFEEMACTHWDTDIDIN